eukprot:m.204138 g.204138  ORF g.204138 m.204138 type:complete len:1622 (-) comp32879_c0_seq1:73-4938(-)
MHYLHIYKIEVQGLPRMDAFSETDPFVEFSLGANTGCTQAVAEGGGNVRFSDEVKVPLPALDSALTVSVKDEDWGWDDTVGSATVNIATVLKAQAVKLPLKVGSVSFVYDVLPLAIKDKRICFTDRYGKLEMNRAVAVARATAVGAHVVTSFTALTTDIIVVGANYASKWRFKDDQTGRLRDNTITVITEADFDTMTHAVDDEGAERPVLHRYKPHAKCSQSPGHGFNANLSPETSVATRLFQFQQMQPGFLSPSPFAIMQTFKAKEGNSIAKSDVLKALAAVKLTLSQQDSALRPNHSSVVVGVSIPVFGEWTRASSNTTKGLAPTTMPRGAELAHPTEDGSSSTIFDPNEHNGGAMFCNDNDDVFFHIKGESEQAVDLLKQVLQDSMGSIASETMAQFCTRRGSENGRVVGCRFGENIRNPADPVTFGEHVLVGADDVDHIGGSFLSLQRLSFNWQAIHQMSETQIEDMIGRNKDDVILPSGKTDSHIRSVRQQDDDGNTTYVYRQNLPFGVNPLAASTDPAVLLAGNSRGDEQGSAAAVFASTLTKLENIHHHQVNRDLLLKHTNSDHGGLFYIPNLFDLQDHGNVPVVHFRFQNKFRNPNPKRFALTECSCDAEAPPNTFGEFSKMDRHFDTRSSNGLMYYNSQDYMHKMTLDPTLEDPPSMRTATLLSDMFTRWEDSWYFPKGQASMDTSSMISSALVGQNNKPITLASIMLVDPDPLIRQQAIGIYDKSIVVRRSWAYRMQLRLYTSDKYGYRGLRKDANGVLRSGADTYRIHPQEIIVGASPDLSLAQGRYMINHLSENEFDESTLGSGWTAYSNSGHMIPDYQKLVDGGLHALKADIDTNRAEHLARLKTRQQSSDTTEAQAIEDLIKQKTDFYDACEISLMGVVDYLSRFAQLAVRMEAECTINETAEKLNLKAISVRCLKLAQGNPATSLVEAVQLIFAYHSCLQLTGEAICTGRFDHYLASFYKDEVLVNKTLSQEQAQEIIDSYWIKLSEKILQNRMFIKDQQPMGYLCFGTPWGGSYPQGPSLGQWLMQVTVGGYMPTNSEIPENPETGSGHNEVAYMCIAAARRLPLTGACLGLRVNKKTPPDLLEEASKAILSGGAHPFLLNDDKICPGLYHSGDDIEANTKLNALAMTLSDSRNYGSTACYEPVVIGKSYFSIGLGCNPMTALECALNQGRTYSAAGEFFLMGKTESFRSEPPSEIKSFDRLKRLYFEHFRFAMQRGVMPTLSNFGTMAGTCPSPLLSTLISGCLERGLDIYANGADYNIIAPLVTGINTAINSLWNINYMVFDKDTACTTLPELLECLQCDWGDNMVEPFVSSLAGDDRVALRRARFQYLRKIAREQVRVGESAEVDLLATEVYSQLSAIVTESMTTSSASDPNNEHLSDRGASEPAKKAMLEQGQMISDHANGKGFGGYHVMPGTGTFEGFADNGLGRGASANGRMSQSYIESDSSLTPKFADEPQLPQRKCPFSTILERTHAVGIEKFTDGAPVDVNIEESYDRVKLQSSLATFAGGQGSNILTITTANPNSFAEAIHKIEQYNLLRVRMGGWSEYFTATYPSLQKQLIRRGFATDDEPSSTDSSRTKRKHSDDVSSASASESMKKKRSDRT